MLEIEATNSFKKDLEKVSKQGKELNKLIDLIDMICSFKVIPQKNKDHQLKGKLKLFRELHVEPDWLLIYQTDKEKNILRLIGTGSHSYLFKN